MKTQIGLDLGRSSQKIVAAYMKEGKLERRRLNFSAAVTRAFRIDHPREAARAIDDTVVVDGKAYFVGATAMLQGADAMQAGMRPDWASTPEHAALLKCAMTKLSAQGVPGLESAHVIVGLPGRVYGIKRGAYEAIVRRHLPGTQVSVMPQPLGPFFATLFDDIGNERHPELTEQSWATVEIGQYTTDTCLVVEGQTIQNAFDSCDGMQIVVRQLMRELAKSRDILDLGFPEATKALEDRQLLHAGEAISIDDELRTACEPLLAKILAHTRMALGDHLRRVDGILIAGGGATLMFPELKKAWPAAVLCDDPRFAVAEGFVRAGLALESPAIKAA